MTDENGRVDILVSLVTAVRAEVAEMRKEHAENRTAAALEQQEIKRLAKAVDVLSVSVSTLSDRLDGIEDRTGYLPTANRALSYIGVGTICAAFGAAANALFGV